MIEILSKYKEAFLQGLGVTLHLCLIIWIVGILIGTLIGVFSARFRFVSIPARLVSFLLSGIPVLVFLFWLHYPFQALFNIVVDPFYTAAITFTFINTFAVSDIVRTAINDLPSQYTTAARVLGVKESKIVLKVQLPLILRQILPSLLILEVNMLHLTLFASLISVEEIFRVSQRINSMAYKPVEIYTALGLFFLMISLPINGFAFYLRKKFILDFSEK